MGVQNVFLLGGFLFIFPGISLAMQPQKFSGGAAATHDAKEQDHDDDEKKIQEQPYSVDGLMFRVWGELKEEDFEEKEALGSHLHDALESGLLARVQAACNVTQLERRNMYGHTPLFVAVARQSLPMVRFLMEKRPNVKAVSRTGETIMHVAAAGGNVQIGRLLAQANAPLDKVVPGLGSPLHVAAQKGKTPFVQFLLGQNTQLANVLDTNGEIALHAAARHGQQDAAQALLSHSNINAQNILGQTALQLSCAKKQIGMVRFLLGNGAHVTGADFRGWTPMHESANAGNQELVQLLMQAPGSDVNVLDRRGCMPLDVAAQQGKATLVRFLQGKNARSNCFAYSCARSRSVVLLRRALQQGCDINAPGPLGERALHVSARTGDWRVGKCLLDAPGIEINAANHLGETALHTAIDAKKGTFCGHLLERGIDAGLRTKAGKDALADAPEAILSTIVQTACASSSQKNPLRTRVVLSHPRLVRYAVKNGYDVGKKQEKGPQPLHVAAEAGLWGAASVLLKNGAHINGRDPAGNTPLHIGAAKGHTAFCRRLVEVGAKPDLPNRLGNAPLHGAAKNGHADIVTFFVGLGPRRVQVNRKNHHKNTALHVSTAAGHLPVVQVLMERGADWTISNTAGLLPYQLAVRAVEQTPTQGKPSSSQATLTQSPCLTPRSAVTSALGKSALFEEVKEADEKDGTPKHSLKQPYVNETRQERFGELVRFFTQEVKADKHGNSLLHAASAAGDEQLVRNCLNQGMGVDAQNKRGESPLHKAVAANQAVIVHMLLVEGKANVKARDKRGYTLMHLAASRGNLAIIGQLLSHGAEIDVRAVRKETPFFLAVHHAQLEAAQRLADLGACTDVYGIPGLNAKQKAWVREIGGQTESSAIRTARLLGKESLQRGKEFTVKGKEVFEKWLGRGSQRELAATTQANSPLQTEGEGKESEKHPAKGGESSQEDEKIQPPDKA